MKTSLGEFENEKGKHVLDKKVNICSPCNTMNIENLSLSISSIPEVLQDMIF